MSIILDLFWTWQFFFGFDDERIPYSFRNLAIYQRFTCSDGFKKVLIGFCTLKQISCHDHQKPYNRLISSPNQKWLDMTQRKCSLHHKNLFDSNFFIRFFSYYPLYLFQHFYWLKGFIDTYKFQLMFFPWSDDACQRPWTEFQKFQNNFWQYLIQIHCSIFCSIRKCDTLKKKCIAKKNKCRQVIANLKEEYKTGFNTFCTHLTHTHTHTHTHAHTHRHIYIYREREREREKKKEEYF